MYMLEILCLITYPDRKHVHWDKTQEKKINYKIKLNINKINKRLSTKIYINILKIYFYLKNHIHILVSNMKY